MSSKKDRPRSVNQTEEQQSNKLLGVIYTWLTAEPYFKSKPLYRRKPHTNQARARGWSRERAGHGFALPKHKLLFTILRFPKSLSFNDSRTVGSTLLLTLTGYHFFFNTITRLVAHCLLLLYQTLRLNVFATNADYINYKKVWHRVHWSKPNINLKEMEHDSWPKLNERKLVGCHQIREFMEIRASLPNSNGSMIGCGTKLFFLFNITNSVETQRL